MFVNGKVHLLECLWKVVCLPKVGTDGFYKRLPLFADSEKSPCGPHGCGSNEPTLCKRPCPRLAGNTNKAVRLPGRLFGKNNKHVGGQREPWFSGKTVRASVIGAICWLAACSAGDRGARLNPTSVACYSGGWVLGSCELNCVSLSPHQREMLAS